MLKCTSKSKNPRLATTAAFTFPIFTPPLAATLVLLLLLSATSPPVSPAPDRAAVSAGYSCSLPAPAFFDADRLDAGAALLTWSPVSGAASYRLTVYHLVTQEVVSNTVEYGASKSLGGLEAGQSYRAVLASICYGGTTSDFVISEDIID